MSDPSTAEIVDQLDQLDRYNAEPTRRLEFRDSELGLIALAIERLASSTEIETLAAGDRLALEFLSHRSARW
jgi:hypothetical protein